MSKVRLGPIVPYFTGGICIVHVEDVVTGFLAALERGYWASAAFWVART